MRPTNAESDEERSIRRRVVAIDALRGWMMLLTVSADVLLAGLWELAPSVHVRQLLKEFTHAEWHGITYYDAGLPGYVFVMGAAIGLARYRARAKGTPGRTLVAKIIRRTAILFALGIVCTGGLTAPWPEVRLVGPLQRLAICYAAGCFLAWNFGWRSHAVLLVSILLGYWAMLAWIPYPGAELGRYSLEGNLVAFVDRMLLPGQKYHGTWDPEGILSTLPAIGTCLSGLLVGRLFLVPMTEVRRCALLFGGGAVAVAISILWSHVLPFNKALWTSSFALATGGAAMIHLAVLHSVSDVWLRPRLLRPLIVYGRNSIAAYVGDLLIDFPAIALRLVGGSVALFLGRWSGITTALVVIAMQWSILWWLDRRKIHIGV
jgi:predicted acyltransferase